MSMNLMLERVAADAVVAPGKQAAVAETKQQAGSLQLFDDRDGDDVADGAVFDESDFEDDDFLFAPDGDGNSISLEKAWHGIHFLLTGDAWGGTGPRAFLLNGGTEQGDDQGYGPARYFTADEVRAIAKALDGIAGDDFWANFDAQKMAAADIYPGIWDEAADELEEEYLDYFEMLKEFVAEVAEDGDAMRIVMA